MREKLVSARMNALWFTYIALFLFSLMPNWEIYLNFVEIIGISTGLTVLLNLWSFYRDENLFDERKKKVVTNGMAWAFVVVSLLMIPMGTTGVEIDANLVRETAIMGLWTWLIYFSVSNLYHKYGDDFW
ncbi:MAG: hypothetical protein ABEJ72_03600 [Candidatus Aenigmatarchaeota archaeon]